MEIKKVVVAGGGVLGSQIAFQSAYCGYDVTIWLRSEGSVKRCQAKIDALKETYLKDLALMNTAEGKSPLLWARGLADIETFNYEECVKKVENAYANLKLVIDLKEAVADADVVIESMAEIAKEKTEFYHKLAAVLPEKSYILTNSSTLLPSQFAKDTGRAEKYCSFHFANTIHRKNTVEVMRHATTNDETFNMACELGEGIRMVVFKVNKEKSGYILNSLLVPFLLSAFDLVANGVANVEDVDKCWRLATGAPLGPFQIADNVGLQTCLNIVDKYQKVPGIINHFTQKMMLPYNFKGMKKLIEKYMAEGRMGKACGHGFYDYK